MEKISLPEQVIQIITALEKSGEEAYAVGGCVRDSLLGRIPKDWDITTSAKPEKVKQLFRHTVDTGIEHGTVTVLLGREGFEVTTYRIDGKYEDGRHPSKVIFTPSLSEDLRRRDFTINAMAYNDRCGLVDLFGGREDLSGRVIRCVGDAKARLGEDALRIMRAVRFAAQLDFAIEPDTAGAAMDLAPNLRLISAERVREELVKLLTSDHPEKLRDLYQMGITDVVLPEFDRIMRQEQNGKHHDRTVGEHTISALQHCRADRVLRLTMLLHDIAKPDVAAVDERGIWQFPGHAEAGARAAAGILRRLKFDNETIRAVTVLVREHSMYPDLQEEAIRRSICRTGEELYPLYLEVRRADILAQKKEGQAKRLAHMDQVEAIWKKILGKGDCLSLKHLQIDGRDLIRDGMRPEKEIGRVLQALLDDVLADPSHNRKEYLLSESRKLRKEE